MSIDLETMCELEAIRQAHPPLQIRILETQVRTERQRNVECLERRVLLEEDCQRLQTQIDEWRDSLHRGVELRAALDDELNAEHKRRVMAEEDCAKFLDQRDDLEKQLKKCEGSKGLLMSQVTERNKEIDRLRLALAVKSDPRPAAEMGKIIDDLAGERDNLLTEREELWEEREKAQEKFDKIEELYCKEINKDGDLDRQVNRLRQGLDDILSLATGEFSAQNQIAVRVTQLLRDD